jgi:hypothetical protein
MANAEIMSAKWRKRENEKLNIKMAMASMP